MNLLYLDAWDANTGLLNVIIETTKGARNKLDYNPELELFELSKVLPRGLAFPYDFGFIPSTLADDGDPLDVLVLLDEPVPAGCRVPARLIGVIEAEQVEDGQTERNDRLIAVAHDFHEHRDMHSIKDLHPGLVQEIENFFISYNKMAGKKFKPIAVHGPTHADKLVKQGIKRFREQHAHGQEQPAGNGKQKAAKR